MVDCLSYEQNVVLQVTTVAQLLKQVLFYRVLIMVYNIHNHSILYFLDGPVFNFLEHWLTDKVKKLKVLKKKNHYLYSAHLIPLGIQQYNHFRGTRKLCSWSRGRDRCCLCHLFHTDPDW